MVSAVPPYLDKPKQPQESKTPRVAELLRKALAWRALLTSGEVSNQATIARREGITRGCFRHQLLLPRPYLVLTKPLRLDIQCQRGASVKIGWKYLDD